MKRSMYCLLFCTYCISISTFSAPNYHASFVGTGNISLQQYSKNQTTQQKNSLAYYQDNVRAQMGRLTLPSQTSRRIVLDLNQINNKFISQKNNSTIISFNNILTLHHVNLNQYFHSRREAIGTLTSLYSKTKFSAHNKTANVSCYANAKYFKFPHASMHNIRSNLSIRDINLNTYHEFLDSFKPGKPNPSEAHYANPLQYYMMKILLNGLNLYFSITAQHGGQSALHFTLSAYLKPINSFNLSKIALSSRARLNLKINQNIFNPMIRLFFPYMSAKYAQNVINQFIKDRVIIKQGKFFVCKINWQNLRLNINGHSNYNKLFHHFIGTQRLIR